MNAKKVLLSLMIAAASCIVVNGLYANYSVKLLNKLPFPVKVKAKCAGADKGWETVLPDKEAEAKCLKGTLCKGAQIKYTIPGESKERELDTNWGARTKTTDAIATAVPEWDIKKSGDVFDSSTKYILKGFKIGLGARVDMDSKLIKYNPDGKEAAQPSADGQSVEQEKKQVQDPKKIEALKKQLGQMRTMKKPTK